MCIYYSLDFVHRYKRITISFSKFLSSWKNKNLSRLSVAWIYSPGLPKENPVIEIATRRLRKSYPFCPDNSSYSFKVLQINLYVSEMCILLGFCLTVFVVFGVCFLFCFFFRAIIHIYIKDMNTSWICFLIVFAKNTTCWTFFLNTKLHNWNTHFCPENLQFLR